MATTTVRYPYSFDVETVFGVFTRKDFIEQKYASVGATNLKFLEYGEKDGTFIIHTERDINAEIPGFAKRFLNPTTTIVQKEVWTLSEEPVKKGVVDVKAKGLPMQMAGNIVLQPTNEGSENILTYEIKVNIPLVGGKLASFLDVEGQKTGNKEYEFAVEFLNRI
jgi:cytochrome c biogenesis protein ResB